MSPAFARLALVIPLAVATLGAARPAPIVVRQQHKLFSRSELTVAAGDSLTFVNDDDVSHNVFSSTSGFRFNLKRQAPGTSVSVPFTSKGVAQIRCAFHPTMTLTVTVR
jgi:plastocyanin